MIEEFIDLNIKECIQKNGLQIEVDELKQCQSVDIVIENTADDAINRRN